MARRDALMKLHRRLVARRDHLRQVLAQDLEDLRRSVRGSYTSDPIDAAFDAGSDEISSQLAEFEARELACIERAIEQLKRGEYGICETCGKKIPVARLNALPYSTNCIECQREMERNPDFGYERHADWGRIYDSGAATGEEREVDISQLENDYSGK